MLKNVQNVEKTKKKNFEKHFFSKNFTIFFSKKKKKISKKKFQFFFSEMKSATQKTPETKKSFQSD